MSTRDLVNDFILPYLVNRDFVDSQDIDVDAIATSLCEAFDPELDDDALTRIIVCHLTLPEFLILTPDLIAALEMQVRSNDLPQKLRRCLQ